MKVLSSKNIGFWTDYFSNNVYKNWTEKYLNERITYNNTILGGIGYSIYVNDVFISTTTETSYTYSGTITDNTKITVKSTYLNYAPCQSDGATINVSIVDILPPVITPPDTPNTEQDIINDFEIKLNVAKTITKDEFDKNKTSLVTIVSNNKDVTKDAVISITDFDETSILPSQEITISVIYNSKVKTEVINVTK